MFFSKVTKAIRFGALPLSSKENYTKTQSLKKELQRIKFICLLWYINKRAARLLNRPDQRPVMMDSGFPALQGFFLTSGAGDGKFTYTLWRKIYQNFEF